MTFTEIFLITFYIAASVTILAVAAVIVFTLLTAGFLWLFRKKIGSWLDVKIMAESKEAEKMKRKNEKFVRAYGGRPYEV